MKCPNTTSERVDRSYLDDRNRAILHYAASGNRSLEDIAQRFGLERRTVSYILRNARTIPNANITYLTATGAISHGRKA